MRFIIIIALLYVLYRLFKKPAPQGSAIHSQAGGEIDDIMVKDPYCETHFPKRDGVYLRFQGSDFLFCSQRCRDRFVAMHEKKT
jgi:hypothetical protein